MICTTNISHQLREGTRLMLKRFACFTLLSAALLTPAWADTDIVLDDFESYADTAAMQAKWVSTIGSTSSTFLFDATTPSQPYPLPPTPGALQGKAALFDGTIGVGAGSVNKWATAFTAAPSATQNVVLSVDLGYDQVINNKKLSVGLRYTNGATTENLIELGFWNQFAFPPILQFGHRAILMPGGNNWQTYGLADTYNELNEMDHSGSTTINGNGFHRFSATISTTDITFGLDLFNDGINNSTGAPGLDAQDVVAAAVTANGFNDLRFGIPSASGSSSNPLLAVDNVSLRLVDVIAPPEDSADFDDDGDVDGRDFLTWQRGFGISDGTALLADGDANDDGNVNGADLGIWQNQYGEPGHLTAGVAAIPEPSTGILLLAACSSLFVRKRR
jgi:hypothetical protein